ncbi:MAG: histidine kinase [Gemmatimonadetes bacterium]|nr:histidine kinase [Gemmatimonadota bacterium]
MLAFWAGAWMLVSAMRTAHLLWLAPANERDLHHALGVLDDAIQYGVWALLTPLIFWLAWRLPVTRRNWARRVPAHALVGLAASLATMVVLLVLHNHYAHYPGEDYYHPPGGTGPWSPGDLFRYFIEYGSNRNHFVFYGGILTAGFAFHSYRVLKEQQLANARVRSQLAEARMQALRMQLHPHFLFNTLNTISSLTERNPRGARRVIARLSELLRRALESTREQEVTLRDELRFARGYLEIVRERFPDRLRVEFGIDPATEAAMVPNLLLQPILENAVEHGIANSLGEGWIRVESECRGGRLYLRVSDSGPGVRDEGITEGVGLSNTRARLEQLYGRGAALALAARPAGGATSVVSLPYRTSGAPADAQVPARAEQPA